MCVMACGFYEIWKYNTAQFKICNNCYEVYKTNNILAMSTCKGISSLSGVGDISDQEYLESVEPLGANKAPQFELIIAR